MSDSRDDFIIAIRYALLRKGTKQKFSLFFLIILSIAIIALDRSSFKVTSVSRAILNDLVYQVAIITSSPGKIFNNFIKISKQHFVVYKENETLKNEIRYLKTKEFQTSYLKTENLNLKYALSLSDSGRFANDTLSVVARVTLDKKSPYLKSLLLNKGKKDGIIKGMTVFSDNFLLGNIVEANYLSSRVLLITDLNSKIPVIIQNSTTNAILSGNGKKNDLILEYLPDEFVLEANRVIYSSGKGGILDAGIPVAETFLNKKNKIGIKVLADPDQASIVQVKFGQTDSDGFSE
tara:strand:- start:118 stop:993 length:876 start_codon:yes stop_codon:yes gene_type:complete